MFCEYSLPVEAPPALLFADFTVQDHTELLTALVTSRGAVREFMSDRNLAAAELNKAVKTYRTVERAVQQAVAARPNLAKGAVESAMVTRYDITEGLAEALLAAMQARNSRGNSWSDLKAAIVDTVTPDPEEEEV